jgi:hypothetical protein
LRLGVSAEAVRAEFKKTPRPHVSGPDEGDEVSAEAPEAQPPSAHEHWLIKLLFLHEEFAGWAAEHLDANWILHSLTRQIVSRRLAAHRQQTWQNLGTFLDECEVPDMQNLITAAAAEQRPIPNPAQQLADIAVRLRNQFIDRQLQTLTQRASQPGTDDSTLLEINREQNELRNLKRQPLPPPQS